MEKRVILTPELRVTENEDVPKIMGYAAVFDILSEDLGGWKEKVAPGAFLETLADDVRALVDHESTMILGRTAAGTLSLKEDDRGLFAEIIPPDTTAGRDAVTSIGRGDISGMSFMFDTITDSWETVDGVEIRTLKKVKLYDVSVVTFPAYPDTTVGLRCLQERKKPNMGGLERRKKSLQLAEKE